MSYLTAFITGGIICVIGQLLIDKTKLTSARILVLFVVLGVILTALGIYEPIVEFGGAGATVPLTGFGYSLAKGVMKDVDSLGFLGILKSSASFSVAPSVLPAHIFAIIVLLFLFA